tara:strand:- start:3574 stop:4371 length:798 start_codon:yes stop_codon:yes gene_type:complete
LSIELRLGRTSSSLLSYRQELTLSSANTDIYEISLQTLDRAAISFLKKHNLLREAARSEIISDAVSSVALTDDESKECWERYLEEHNIGDDLELEQHLRAKGLNVESLQSQVERRIKIKKYSERNFMHKTEARFLANKDQLDRVIYSLLRVKDGFLARELYLRIAGNESNFADLSAAYSLGPEAKTKGIVGPVPINQAHPVLSERLRTSRPNQLMEPFCIGDWWIIARLERFESARFEEKTSSAMAQQIFLEWVDEQLACKMEGL